MEKSLTRRTTYHPFLAPKLVEAMISLDLKSRGQTPDLKQAEYFRELLEESYRTSISSTETRLIGSLEWDQALTVNLIPRIYGIARPMPYRKEHFEAGLALILDEFKDLKTTTDLVRLNFMRNIFVILSNSLLYQKARYNSSG